MSDKSPKVVRAVVADATAAATTFASSADPAVCAASSRARARTRRGHEAVRSESARSRATSSRPSAAQGTGIGSGQIGASTRTAGVGDFKHFKGVHPSGFWMDSEPVQNARGGKTVLGRIK